MKRGIILIIISLILFSSCGGEAPRQRVPDNYRSWEKTYKGVLTYPIGGHGDTSRIIYINERGEAVTETEIDGRTFYEYPVGTIVVKEVYARDNPVEQQKPTQLTVMIKDPAAPESLGGWVWVVKDPASGNETVFTSSFCINCHSDANERHSLGAGNPRGEYRDYVFIPYEKHDNKGKEGYSY